MMRVLHHEQLVQTFLAETGGSPIAFRAALVADPSTPSGYAWSSGLGPDLELSSGTSCAGFVTVRTQRPLSLLLPGLDGGSGG